MAPTLPASKLPANPWMASVLGRIEQHEKDLASSVFPRFERHEFVYKTLDDTPFPATALIPKATVASLKEQASPKPLPLIVHFHGGGLSVGISLEPAFLSKWLLELAEARGAIIIDPAYRLVPEVDGPEILRDVEDFWVWVHSSFPAALAAVYPELVVDLDHVAVTGESAGGFLALQSAFILPQQSKTRLVMTQYPTMYPDVRALRPPPPQASAEYFKFVDDYVAEHKGRIRLGTKFPGGWDLTHALGVTGRRDELIVDPRFALTHSLKVAGTIPPIWVAQGDADQIIPRVDTDRMVDMIKEAHPYVKLLYSVQPGSHGFDTDQGIAEPWIAEAIKFVDEHWL